jgi:pSer/pThr/pTyr-binding forkhead associated (FHA) protein
VRGFGYSFAGGVREERETGPLPDPSPSPSGQTEFRVIWNRQEIALAEGENVLGRTRQARVWVDHSSVSRRHAVIRVHDDQATLEDCASKNGTFLRGQRLKAAATLKDGDELILGRARLVFRAHTVEVSTATSTGE